jgi:hypothetical protein
MLAHCAPGYRMELKKHRYWVYCPGKEIFRDLPKGEHGIHDPEIQMGKVKKMARFLNIEECAATFFPAIIVKEAASEG